MLTILFNSCHGVGVLAVSVVFYLPLEGSKCDRIR